LVHGGRLKGIERMGAEGEPTRPNARQEPQKGKGYFRGLKVKKKRKGEEKG